MIKQEIVKIFKANPKKNFKLYTNVSVGLGTNGVDYRTYIGCYINGFDYQKTKILGLGYDSLVIQTDNHSEQLFWDNGKRTIFIPYNNIVCIEFFEEGCKPYRGSFPLVLDEEHCLEELKEYNFKTK